MNHTEKTIPVWEKYSLNVSEAAEYYGIGEKRLRQIAGENEGADFILEVILAKRRSCGIMNKPRRSSKLNEHLMKETKIL